MAAIDSAPRAYNFGGPLFIPPQPQPPNRPYLHKPMPTYPSSQPPEPKSSGGMIAFNLILVAIVIIAAWVKLGPGGRILDHYLSAMKGPPDLSSPAPAATAPPSPAASPAPVLSQPPPAPAARPFDPADLAGNLAAWPKAVALKQQTTFPAVLNAQVVGSVDVPAGTLVKLVNIEGETLELEYQGGRQMVPWQLTDLEQRVRQAAPAGAPR